MKAMIFAAGLGSRLGKITENIPKALLEVNGKNLLRYGVENCVKAGFGEIIVNVHYQAHLMVKEIESLRAEGYNIEISDETDKLLDTGGGLYKARHFFGEEPFLLYNGDIITDADIGQLYAAHVKKGGIATLLARNRPAVRVFLVDQEGRLAGWRNRTTGEEILVDYPWLNSNEGVCGTISAFRNRFLEEIAFSCIHMVDPSIFDYMEEGVYSFTPFYLDLAGKRDIFVHKDESGYWFDIGTPEKLVEAKEYFSTAN
ncbi:MAG TPA: nucleotidyltransferase family protein [Bacteroidetes bacterium]|nr:nucleotidyltransferase family protein [Bacteroidota bacterium]